VASGWALVPTAPKESCAGQSSEPIAACGEGRYAVSDSLHLSLISQARNDPSLGAFRIRAECPCWLDEDEPSGSDGGSVIRPTSEEAHKTSLPSNLVMLEFGTSKQERVLIIDPMRIPW
jgi:hypothetical protein